MTDTQNDAWLVVGKITGCYGVKGWVRIHSYTEPQDNFLTLKELHLLRSGQREPVAFDQCKAQGKGLVAHIAGVDERTLAESFRGVEIAVPESVLPTLEEGDYYWRQLQGLAVWLVQEDSRVLLGNVDHLIETGANDVLVVKACDGSVDDRERLIPYLPAQTIVKVDLTEALIEVDWFLDE